MFGIYHRMRFFDLKVRSVAFAIHCVIYRQIT